MNARFFQTKPNLQTNLSMENLTQPQPCSKLLKNIEIILTCKDFKLGIDRLMSTEFISHLSKGRRYKNNRISILRTWPRGIYGRRRRRIIYSDGYSYSHLLDITLELKKKLGLFPIFNESTY